MNDNIATAFLMALAGAMVVGILYIAFVPIQEGKEAADSKRIEATLACIEHSGASKDRDYRLAGYKAAKCAEQTR